MSADVLPSNAWQGGLVKRLVVAPKPSPPTDNDRLRDLIALRRRIDNEIRVLSKQLDKRKRASKHVRPVCGTEQGYHWHRYNDRDNWPLPADDPCGCRAAHAAEWRLKDQLRRATA